MPVLKYIASGLFTTSLTYGTFLSLYWGTSSVALSLVSASIIGMISSFTLNRFWIWKLGDKRALHKFILIQVSAILINWILLHLISLTTFPRSVAQFFIYLFFALVLYNLNKKFIFTNN